MLLLRDTASLLSACNVPGLLPGKTVVDFDRRWDSGEECWVEWLLDEISIGQERLAGEFVVMSNCPFETMNV
jgi:hypothetical protein